MSLPGDGALPASRGTLPVAGPDGPQVERFRGLVARHLGLRFEDDKLGWLGEVLRRRMEAGPLDAEAYLARLEAAPGAGPELAALAPELTVVETYFFRNREQFLALQEQAVPQCLAAWPGRRSLRILSAGCASGEEPYSIAMTLHALRADPAHEVSIQAVDLNPQMIEKARRGRYTAWSLRDTPAWLQQRWFRPQGQELLLDESVRAAVDFQQRNLSEDDAVFWQPGLYDVVFCRNVLMYFTPPVAQAVMARITRALAPGGYLFLGHAETLRSLSQDYELCHTHGTFYYRRHPGPGRTAAAEAARPPPPPVAAAQPGTWFEDIGLAAERIRLLTQEPDPDTAPAPMPPRPLYVGPRSPQTAPAPLGGSNCAWGGPAHSCSAGDLLAPALDLLRHERFAQALERVQGLPADAARRPDVLLLKGVLLAHAGRLGDAEQASRQVLALDAAHAGAHHVLALCREGAGDLAGAAGHDRAAIALDPAFAMPRLHLGLLAQRTGDSAAVRRELGQALALLAREDAARLLLFGGGFDREALLALCRAGLQACEEGAP